MHTPFEELPDTAFLRERELLRGLVPFSSATLWRRVKTGAFPTPLKLESHITVWRVGDIRAWMEDRYVNSPRVKYRGAKK